RLAGLYALGRCRFRSERGGEVEQRLREVLANSLNGGDIPTAVAVIEALGTVGDQRHVPLMLDVVDRFSDQPMLQYAAGRAAARLDREAGVEALMELCGSWHDEVRELAAWRISQMEPPPVERLMTGMQSGGDPLRGGAALALALCGVCELGVDEPLVPWLVRRFDTNDVAFELSWQIRANYLSARILCHDDTARADLEVYWLNRHVSRMGLYVALLASGDLLPMEALLGELPVVDVASFLRDAGFGEVLARYVPEAPRFAWQEDEALRRYQVDRLRDWWRVFRHRLVFDGQRRVFVVR
ncbi:MAG: HEAT repeat domain-containing protein, partial [Phycisphaerae bacterium]